MTGIGPMPGWADLVVAATPSPAPTPYDPAKSTAGIALLFVIGLAVAVVFLIRSMRKRLAGIDVERHQREQGVRRQAQRPREDSGDGLDGG